MEGLAFKAVGVGSVGTFCAVGLFISADGDPLFLQIKEAGKSALEYLGPKFSGHPGRRVVEGQHIMQASSDIFLGWSQDDASGRHFYVRELKNRRLGAISELIEENALVNYAHLCGRTLARAHARSADPAVLAGYMGKSSAFDDALASFAMAYADRTQRDYDQLTIIQTWHGQDAGRLIKRINKASIPRSTHHKSVRRKSIGPGLPEISPSLSQLIRHLAAVLRELQHHLFVQPDVHCREIILVAGVVKLIGKLFTRGKA